MKKIIIALALLLGGLTVFPKGPSKKEPTPRKNYCTMREKCEDPDCWIMEK